MCAHTQIEWKIRFENCPRVCQNISFGVQRKTKTRQFATYEKQFISEAINAVQKTNVGRHSISSCTNVVSSLLPEPFDYQKK